jgi:Lrp/AsnC family leucine-responsive transcriptional regulator
MPQSPLDDLDRKILDVLQRSGRISLTDLSAAVGAPSSSCLRRIKRLERDRIIRRYAAVLRQDAVGLPVDVFVSVKLKSRRADVLDGFARAIAQWPQVLECYLMTGKRDYWMRVVVPDLAAFEDFVRQKLGRIDNVAAIETNFVMERLKHERVLPLAQPRTGASSPA